MEISNKFLKFLFLPLGSKLDFIDYKVKGKVILSRSLFFTEKKRHARNSIHDMDSSFLDRLRKVQIKTDDINEKQYITKNSDLRIEFLKPDPENLKYNVINIKKLERILLLNDQDPLTWNGYVLGRTFNVPENMMEKLLKTVNILKIGKINESNKMFDTKIKRNIIYRIDEISMEY